jgi:transposase
MAYRPYGPSVPLLRGYDPHRDLPMNHLARLVEQVVEQSLTPTSQPDTAGQPAFDPRLCAKVLVYGYSTGVRSSRQLQRMCEECLPYLYLTRGDTPSYHTLCTFRVEHSDLIETVWVGLFAIASEVGLARLGRITIDSTKMRADAGPEAVVKADEYDDVLRELRQILKEAQTADTNEATDAPGTTRLQKQVEPQQMRAILRRVRKQRSQAKHPPNEEVAPCVCEPGPLGPRMKPRIEAAIAAIEEAMDQESKHACLTDPDASMMGEGREKRVRECYSYEVAVDNGLLVAGQTCETGQDNSRLLPLIQAAQEHEEIPIVAVDSDSGYYSGDTIAFLIQEGLDVCIPTPHTACDLHRQQAIGTTRQSSTGSVVMDFDAQANHYTCPQGNVLSYRTTSTVKGQQMRQYRAQESCVGCPLRTACGNRPDSKHRTLSVGIHHEVLHAQQQRFADPQHVARYRQRAHMVETVFGCLRAILGYSRFMVRGKKRVAAESRLFTAALQIRKIHSCLSHA